MRYKPLIVGTVLLAGLWLLGHYPAALAAVALVAFVAMFVVPLCGDALRVANGQTPQSRRIPKFIRPVTGRPMKMPQTKDT